MNTQQECPECPGNGNLSWQEPVVIQLYESEVSGDCTGGSGASEYCLPNGNGAQGCAVGVGGG